MFQVIVRIEQLITGEGGNSRPFNWISSSHEEVGEDIITKLAKYAARDMNFNQAELAKLRTFVLEAAATGQKQTYFGLNDNESIVIEIRDQDDIEGQKAAINKLLFPE